MLILILKNVTGLKKSSTNYYNTFIEIADDCQAIKGEVPPLRGGKKTVAGMEYDLLNTNPYGYTSDEIIFRIYSDRKKIPARDMAQAQEMFFSTGRPCFRASALTKR